VETGWHHLTTFFRHKVWELSKLIRHGLYGWKPGQGLTALFNPYVI